MVISSWTLYWITRLDAIGGLAGVFAASSAVMVALLASFLIVNAYETGYDRLVEPLLNKLQRVLKWSVSIFVLSVLSVVLIPSTKEMAAILVVPAIINNEQVQKDATELYDLAKDYMKKTLENKNEKSTK